MAVPKSKVSKQRRNKRRSSVWKLETPGVTSKGIARSASASICSRMAPYKQGSPVCSRTVVLCSASIWRITASTCSNVISALL